MIDGVAHTEIIRHPDGSVSTRNLGPSHVVPGSVRVIDLPPGTVVVIRHLAPDTADATGVADG